MFDKKPKISTEQFGKTNRIVEGTTIKGDIISQADFRLDGQLHGNFKSNGKLVVGPAGSITGDISCENADFEGKFEGKLEISDLLNVKATATIKGQVMVGRLSMEPGALFMATCNMKSNTTTQTPVLKDAK